MIRSMTGFGEAAGEADGIAYSIEIRTVNNRYFKAMIRMPESLSFLNDTVDKLLKTHIRRGTVNYSLQIKNVAGQVLFDVDELAIQGYITKLKKIAESSGIDYQINLAQLLTLPGIIQSIVPDAETAEKMKASIVELTNKAIEGLTQMRLCEGQALVADLMSQCEVIKEKLELIATRQPEVLEQYYERIKKRAEDLIGDVKVEVESDTLAREAAIFAERSDIAEEIARLSSHISQFQNICESNGHGGRKLDFIGQEMLREANTIASKSADVQIGQWVIDIKCAIDRIKEQVQNVE
jgi:uncharacterized protein (TIGR00255 family)